MGCVVSIHDDGWLGGGPASHGYAGTGSGFALLCRDGLWFSGEKEKAASVRESPWRGDGAMVKAGLSVGLWVNACLDILRCQVPASELQPETGLDGAFQLIAGIDPDQTGRCVVEQVVEDLRVLQQQEGNALVWRQSFAIQFHGDPHRCFHLRAAIEALRAVESMRGEVGQVFIRLDRGDDTETGGGVAIRARVPLVRYVGGGKREIHWIGMGLVEMRCTLRVRGMGGKSPPELSGRHADHASADPPEEHAGSFKML